MKKAIGSKPKNNKFVDYIRDMENEFKEKIVAAQRRGTIFDYNISQSREFMPKNIRKESKYDESQS